MASKIIRGIPLNRVEGDLEIKVEITDGVVTDAWSCGTMFRGFERILPGRGAMDGLVITPRVCGMCTVCHLTTAAKALDMISGAKVPGDAMRVRNAVLATEHLMSDMRHAFLLFMVDFVNPAYKGHSLFAEALKRYEPFKGRTALDTIHETKRVLEIIATLGGQWPHTSFMVPGGIASIPYPSDIQQARQTLAVFRHWYETKVLGCAIERWREIRNSADLTAWLKESPAHQDGEVGFFIRFAREAGLHEFGKGHGNFISYGAMDMPDDTKVIGMGKGTKFIPAGFATGKRPGLFDQAKIAEHVAYSWFEDYPGGKHPMDGETKPYATGQEGRKYSWTKAPRYDGEPAETGPLAEMVIAEEPLFADFMSKVGPNVFTRELARLVRGAYLIPAIDGWLKEIRTDNNDYYRAPKHAEDGEGFGLTEAARGALGHWVKIKSGKIEHYQIITPTSWNSSPRDEGGVMGPWEKALVGTKVKDIENAVELGHVIRSFDSCMVCSVHTFEKGKHKGSFTIG